MLLDQRLAFTNHSTDCQFFPGSGGRLASLFQLGVQLGDFSGWNASRLILPQRG